MKKILLPTDFSDNALNAIKYAIYLFEKEECTFYILHVVQIGPSGYSSSYNKGRDTRLYRLTMEEAERSIQELRTTLKVHEQNPKHIFEYLTSTEPLMNAIGSNVINKDIDYIFMGTKGASGVKSIFMGSNTVSVIKHIDFCPLVAVPEDYNFDLPDEILFATDFKHDYIEAELTPLKAIAKLWNSKIVLVYFGLTGELDDNQRIVMDSLKEKLAEFSVRMDKGYADFSVATAINQYATDNKAIGLVSMMNRKHGFFEKLTREPIVKSIAFSTEVPLFIFQKIE